MPKGRVLETIPIMEYVRERMKRALGNEKQLRDGNERANGMMEMRDSACLEFSRPAARRGIG